MTFHARAWDPQGRDLTWSLDADGQPFGETVVGTEVDLIWTVRKKDVGLHRYIYVSVKSSGEYHRHTHFDQRGVFLYRVDPPDEAN